MGRHAEGDGDTVIWCSDGCTHAKRLQGAAYRFQVIENPLALSNFRQNRQFSICCSALTDQKLNVKASSRQ